jgi:hypothetical protein
MTDDLDDPPGGVLGPIAPKKRWAVTRVKAPLRKDWNANPIFKGQDSWCPKCELCGYRDYPINMMDGLCFSCHLHTTNPEEYAAFWAGFDAGRDPDKAKKERINKLDFD